IIWDAAESASATGDQLDAKSSIESERNFPFIAEPRCDSLIRLARSTLPAGFFPDCTTQESVNRRRYHFQEPAAGLLIRRCIGARCRIIWLKPIVGSSVTGV